MSLSEYTRAVLLSSTVMPTVTNGALCTARHAEITEVRPCSACHVTPRLWWLLKRLSGFS